MPFPGGDLDHSDVWPVSVGTALASDVKEGRDARPVDERQCNADREGTEHHEPEYKPPSAART